MNMNNDSGSPTPPAPRRRFQEWERDIKNANSLVRTIGNLTTETIDSIAEFGAFIPIIELVVTIGVFYSSELGDVYGLEVLAGLVLSQIAALYLTAHYADEAMDWLGDAAIYLAIATGALNTGVAIYLALAGVGNVSGYLWLVPAFSSGLAILYLYTAKMFTMKRVHSRQRLNALARAKLQGLKRDATAQATKDRLDQKMRNIRLGIRSAALLELSKSEEMKDIQRRAMWGAEVKNIMDDYLIHPKTVLGKELIEMARVGIAKPVVSPKMGEETNPLAATATAEPGRSASSPASRVRPIPTARTVGQNGSPGI